MMRSARLRTLCGQLLSLSAVLAMSLGVTACGERRKEAWQKDQAAGASSKPAATEGSATEAADLRAKGDEAYKERLTRAKLEEALKYWEKSVEIEEDIPTLVKLSKGYYFLADSHDFLEGYDFVEDEMEPAKKEQMLANYDRGTNFGQRALLLASPEFAAKVQKDGEKSMGEAAKLISKDALPAMYWYATNLGKWAKAKGTTTILHYKNMVKPMMEHVLAIAPEWNHGAGHRYLGAYYSALSGMLGGDADASKKHLNASIKISPHYLTTKVLKATFYADRVQDAKLYEDTLKEVIAASGEDIPELIPEMKMEQRKAEGFLKQLDDRF